MSDFLVRFVGIFANILYVAMIGRVLLSWFNVSQTSPFYPIVRILYQITEPVLYPIRRVLPTFGMLDFSPMVAIILVIAVQKLFVTLV